MRKLTVETSIDCILAFRHRKNIKKLANDSCVVIVEVRGDKLREWREEYWAGTFVMILTVQKRGY